MATQQVLSPFSVLLLLLVSILPVVRGESTSDSLAGLVVACAVAFILLIVIIAVFAMAVTWNTWFPSIQRSKGKVKMPRSYWKKKREAKQKLLMNTSRTSRATASTAVPQENGAVNGNATLVNRAKDTASWVQGWNNASPREEKGYEDVSLTMELGEEKEEPEYRIETSVVDDETLDLGPFSAPVQGGTFEDPTYSQVIPRPRPQQSALAAEEAAAAQVAEAAEAAATTTTSTAEDVTVFTSEQTATIQMDEEDVEDMAPNRASFYQTPLMSKPRQVSSSDTPEPPPLPPPPPPESYSELLENASVAY